MDIKTIKDILKKAKRGTMTRAEYNAALLDWIAEEKNKTKIKLDWYENKHPDKDQADYFNTFYTDLLLIEGDIKNGIEIDFAAVLLELYPELDKDFYK